MSVMRISKQHRIPRGTKKGLTEQFVVEPRSTDRAYCVKPANERSNRDEAYTKVFTLNEVASYTRKGWSVRMRSQVSGDWNTLKSEGLEYA